MKKLLSKWYGVILCLIVVLSVVGSERDIVMLDSIEIEIPNPFYT